MIRKIIFVVCFGLIMFAFERSALACGQCEYKDDFGICWPKGGCIIPNPSVILTAPITLAKALASGKPDEIKTALGNALVNSTGCIGCSYLASKIAPNMSEEQRNRVIGSGFLTFLLTGDPVLVVIDIGTNMATQQPIVSGSDLPPTPMPPGRGSKTYTAQASCILQRGPKVLGAWTDPPILRDELTGQSATFPSVDLMLGDTLILNARVCSEQDDPATGQHAVATANMRYEKSGVVPGGASQLKYWLIGSQAPSVATSLK